MSQESSDFASLPWPDGELARRLLNRGRLSRQVLHAAVEACQAGGKPLAEHLTLACQVPTRDVYGELAAIYGVPFVELKTYVFDSAVAALIGEDLARELNVLPLFLINNTLTVAMADPADVTVTDRLSAATHHTIETCLAAREDLREAINRVYGGSGKVKRFLDEMGDRAVPLTARTEVEESVIQNPESPVSQLVDLILAQAARDRASDVHIDPDEQTLRVRFRVDGLLYDLAPPPRHLHSFIVSRIKVMANLDIADSRLPQDGRFTITVDGRTIDVRVATMPTIDGENVALRLLDAQEMDIPLERLGLDEPLRVQMEALIARPHGLLLVTGPTGSGKSTTLYAMLTRARSPERHIITLEDPVERRLGGITQIPINEPVGLTFAVALRTVLRQDPDAIMVGEIRDTETAQLAVRAALTGHLVFSTVHTRDAPGAVTRLENMGVEPFLLGSSLVGVINQRLVRKVCAECRTLVPLPDPVRQRLEAVGIPPPAQVARGRGCGHCRQTRYRGRIALFEFMPSTSAIAPLIQAGADAGTLRVRAREAGMRSVFEDGIRKAGEGITTVEEVFRVVEVEAMPSAVAAAETTAVSSASTPAPPAGPAGPRLDLSEYRETLARWLGAGR